MYESVLRELLESVPGARGAVFCDDEGEAVFSVGASGRQAPELLDDFDLRVAGAQLSHALAQLRRRAAETLGEPRELVVTAPRETLVVRMLADGYYLVVCLAPGSLPAQALYVLRETARRVESL